MRPPPVLGAPLFAEIPFPLPNVALLVLYLRRVHFGVTPPVILKAPY